jgi:hypothetical protein
MIEVETNKKVYRSYAPGRKKCPGCGFWVTGPRTEHCPNCDGLYRFDGQRDPALGEDRLALRPPFEVLQVGEAAYEVRDRDGVVFAWAGDRGKALVVAGLLEVATRG